MWIYQAVTNVGVQVLVLMGLGYLFARFKFLEQVKFLPQSNFLVLMLALPAFNLYLMGIKLDLQNPEPWKSLAAFLLWVFAVQAAILVYSWRFCSGDAGEAAVMNMVLLMDNYAITGLLALNATLGTKWGTLALLMAMGFFLVIFPFSLAAFEWEKWAVAEHMVAVAEAAAADIEAAAAAAVAAEEAAAADAADGGDAEAKGPPSPDSVATPTGPYGTGGDGINGIIGGDGGGGEGIILGDLDGLELTLYPGADRQLPATVPTAPAAFGPRPAEGRASTANVAGGGGGGGQGGANGIPHESTNEDYRPAHPLLAGGGGGPQTSSSSAAAQPPPQRRAARPPLQWQRRRRQNQPQEQLRQQQQQTGSYVPPALLPPSAEPPGGGGPLVSPFKTPASLGWPKEAASSREATIATAAAAATGQGYPVTAPPSAARPRPAAAALSGLHSGAQSPRRAGSVLASVFDRLAVAGSGQLPASLFGDLGRVGAVATAPSEPDKPRGVQDLQFALTHQLSGGTARQLARISRGYAAAAAAATAAAASPDANLRRLLLSAAGGGVPPSGRSPPLLLPSAAVARRGSETVGQQATPAAADAAAMAAAPFRSVTGPMLAQASADRPILVGGGVCGGGGRTRAGMPPPPSPSAGAGVGVGSFGGGGDGGGGGGSAGTCPASAAPAAVFASLDTGDSVDLMPGLSGLPEGAESDTGGAPMPPPVLYDTDGLAGFTLSSQGAIAAAAGPASAPPGADNARLASSSTPMLNFGRRPQQRMAASATGATAAAATAAAAVASGGAGGGGSGGGGGGADWSTQRSPCPFQRSASEAVAGRRNAAVDKALLRLASGLALDSIQKRALLQRGTGALLADTDTTLLLQLADAATGAAIPDSGGAAGFGGGGFGGGWAGGFGGGGASSAELSDRELVREATREALRRHGGLARAFAAFVSGHPQLWHIVRTLARNPMIWTMFIAMAVSVSGLRVFLDPASPRYRPEVGWVAGSLSWINGLVVPLSIFSNGAWMYGKPLLAKGETVKMVILMLIKVGALPLLMAGCALLVRLDEQHVAAMTVLTLSPAAAASFVLAVQYGRGVELVSLTNILGNVFLTPLLIMWLKVLVALRVNFHLHDDG